MRQAMSSSIARVCLETAETSHKTPDFSLCNFNAG